MPATGSVVRCENHDEARTSGDESESPQLVYILADEFSLELVVGSWTVPRLGDVNLYVICSLLFWALSHSLLRKTWASFVSKSKTSISDK